MTASRCLIVLIAVAIGLLGGCARESVEHGSGESSTLNGDGTAEVYSVSGRVIGVSPDRDFLMVRHDDIPGFMDAMTMPFGVRDTAIVRGIVPGDSVHFEIEYRGGEISITAIKERP